jgi:hypothetical protein
MTSITVYGAIVGNYESKLSQLRFGKVQVKSLKELFNYVHDALYCIDTTSPHVRLYPNDDDKYIIKEHMYLFVTTTLFRTWNGKHPKISFDLKKPNDS